MGVPVIGCQCNVCRSTISENRRLRPSALIRCGEKNYVIDCGPDFREQALKHPICRLDGLLLTHAHNDHIAGIDDLRIFFLRDRQKIPCLLSEETLQDLRVRYHYLLHAKKETAKVSSQFHFYPLKDNYTRAAFEGLDVGTVSYYQNGMKVTGFYFKDFAYITDIHTYSDEVLRQLMGIPKLVISAPRFRGSPVHLGIDEAIEFAKKIGARQTYFTHIVHDVDHFEVNKRLPEGFQLGYDGLNFAIEIDEV